MKSSIVVVLLALGAGCTENGTPSRGMDKETAPNDSQEQIYKSRPGTVGQSPPAVGGRTPPAVEVRTPAASAQDQIYKKGR